VSQWIKGLGSVFSGFALAAILAGPASADSVRLAQWHLAFLKASEAQQISQGDGVVVAVIDTGVDAKHPDLTGSVLSGTDEYKGFSGDGRQDAFGHGTGMAGLIAAQGRSGGRGILGIAPKARILPVRAGVGGNPFPDDVRKSIGWAANHQAKVICVALAGAVSNEWKQALDLAISAGAVIVAGVGNRAQGGSTVAWPAAYPGVLAVGGIDQSGKHAALSVTGPEVDIAAPAVNIVTAGLHGQYVRADGTSAATAIVAGAAALVRSKYPNLSATEVVHRLEATATDAGPPGRDDEYGYGILNLVGALTADVPPLQPSTSPSPGPPTPPIPPAADKPADNSLMGALLAVLLAAGAIGAVITIRRRHR
jgi:type VII secretion-associated serine protease mycosin